MKNERTGSGRALMSFTLPQELKNKIQDIVYKNSIKSRQRETISKFILKSVLLYLKVQEARKFEDFDEIWIEIFTNNSNISLQKKYEILKKFNEKIDKQIKELDEYFSFKKLKNVNDESVKKVEEFGEMASWIKEKIRKKDEKND